MNKLKKEKIRYFKRTDTDEEGIIYPVNKYATIVVSFTKRYHESYKFLFQLEASTRNHLDWLVDTMSADNIVENSEYKRSQFIQLAQKHGVRYTDETIRKSFQKLTKCGVLIPMKIKRGVFQVNPELFFDGEDRKRKTMIKAILGQIPLNDKIPNS